VPRIDVLDGDGAVLAAIDAPAGERLVDALDDARAPVAFGCRSATCGICQIEVVDGAVALAPPDAIERIALEELGARPGDRLACRAALRAGAALAAAGAGDAPVVRIRPRAARR
jgi:ferredoxin